MPEINRLPRYGRRINADDDDREEDELILVSHCNANLFTHPYDLWLVPDDLSYVPSRHNPGVADRGALVTLDVGVMNRTGEVEEAQHRPQTR